MVNFAYILMFMKESIHKDLNMRAWERHGKDMINDSYFYDFRSNIYGGQMPVEFQRMFLAGDGNELVAKACAVHSSSMLGYNFFHWIKEYPLTIRWSDRKEVTYNQVCFEEKMPVLVGTTPANMDIVLRNQNGDVLFIESKFLEYTNSNKFKLSATYNEPRKYYIKGVQWGHLISSIDTKLPTQYWEGIVQEIRHLIAITNWIEGKTDVGGYWYQGIGDVRFIFEPKEVYSEHSAFLAYKERYSELHAKLEENNLVPSALKMEFMTYSELWKIVRDMDNLPKPLKDYLDSHYMVFAK